MSHRKAARITPPCPITSTVARGDGSTIAYGVIFDISSRGARVWTTAALPVGATLRFCISFANPPEAHELDGRVVWTRDALNGARRKTAQCGVQWLDVGEVCAQRIRQLVRRAVPPTEGGVFPFDRPWTVHQDNSPPPLAATRCPTALSVEIRERTGGG